MEAGAGGQIAPDRPAGGRHAQRRGVEPEDDILDGGALGMARVTPARGHGPDFAGLGRSVAPAEAVELRLQPPHAAAQMHDHGVMVVLDAPIRGPADVVASDGHHQPRPLVPALPEHQRRASITDAGRGRIRHAPSVSPRSRPASLKAGGELESGLPAGRPCFRPAAATTTIRCTRPDS